MGKHCQLVMGPAGAGKSTYCRVMQDHCQQLGRTCHVMNMDPACEQFSYNASVDVRDLITLKEVLDEQLLGPNGGLIYAFEHLLANSSWLDDEFGDYADDYVIIDLPGQIELFTHIPVLPRIVELLKNQGYFVASVYLMDSSVVLSDVNKYISSTLTCLSAMLTLEIPSVNFLSKMDLTKRISPDSSLSAYINCDWEMLLADKEKSEMIPKRLTTLTESIGGLLNQFPWVNYQPLDVTSVDSLDAALNIVDRILQYEDEDEAREIREEDNYLSHVTHMESIDTTAAVTALREVLPNNGTGMHIYDLARWWSRSGFERVLGDVDVFIASNCPTEFKIHDGIVTHGDIDTERFLIAERQRREDSWKSIRQDLLTTSENIQTASRHVKLPGTQSAGQFIVRSPPIGVRSPRRTTVATTPSRRDNLMGLSFDTQTQPLKTTSVTADTNTVTDGVKIAANAGLSASLSLLTSAEDQVDCVLNILQSTLGKQLSHSLITNWINKTRDQTTLKADIITKYTPNNEYQGVINVLKRSSNVTVECSSIECGHAEDFIAPGPRLFSTKAEWSPWILIRVHESMVSPTHYTLGYHPGTHSPAPKNWQLDGFPQGGTDWIVLSSHENDCSFEHQSFNEVIVSFQLQPQSLFFKAFRITLPQTHSPTRLPFSGFEVYGAIRPLQNLNMDLPERAHTQLPGVGGAGAGVTVEEDEFVVGKSPNEDPTLIVSALWNRIATAPPPEEYPREELPNERHVSTTDDVKESNWESVIADRLRGAVSLSYTVGDLVRTIIPISFEDMGGGTVAAGEIARVTQVPGEEEGSIAEIQLSDGRKVDAFSHEVEHIDYRFMAVVGALVVLRSEAIITAYQATIYRRLERVRQQVVADFEASLVLRPPGLELLPQKGRDEAFRLHVDNTYTSNMKAVLHDRYKKMYGKAYIEVVGPTDPTPDQKKYRKMGAALVGGAVAASVLALVESGACPNVLDCAKNSPRSNNRRKRAARHRRPILAVAPQA